MIGPTVRMKWHEAETPAELQVTYLSHRDVSAGTRLHAFWMMRCGWQIKEVAESVGVYSQSSQRRRFG